MTEGPYHEQDVPLPISDDWFSVEEYDTPPEVDAVFRAQRRLSFRYGLLFFCGTLLVPAVLVLGGAWASRPVWGGFTLGYLSVGLFYPVFYLSLAVAYTLQANRLEKDLLERRDRP